MANLPGYGNQNTPSKAERERWARSMSSANPPPAAQLGDKAEIAALREALQEQWEANHGEHCRNVWPHDGICYWPKPAILEQGEKEPNQP